MKRPLIEEPDETGYQGGAWCIWAYVFGVPLIGLIVCLLGGTPPVEFR